MVGRIGLLIAALAYGDVGAASESRRDRILRLEKGILAPCCYTEPVSSHQSEIAVKIRLEIERLADQGRSDEEILGEYVRRYGAKVLLDPRTRPQPWSLIAPWAMTGLGAIGVGGLIWRWRQMVLAPASESTDAGQLPDIPDEDPGPRQESDREC